MTSPYITPTWSTVKPSAHYVYVHRRKSDGLVFYVGKGSAKRGWSRDRNFLWWRVYNKHGATIEIVRNFEVESEAYRYESFLISFYNGRGFFLTNLQRIPTDDLCFTARIRRLSVSASEETYDFVHDDHGRVTCTRSDLYRNYGVSQSNLNNVIHKKRFSADGWYIEGRDRRHRDHGKIYEFHHHQHGVVNCTQADLRKKYNLDHQSVSDICRSRAKSRDGWTMKGVEAGPRKNVKHKFYHPEHGFFLATAPEMASMFGVRSTVFTRLSGKHRKTSLGWVLLGDQDDTEDL